MSLVSLRCAHGPEIWQGLCDTFIYELASIIVWPSPSWNWALTRVPLAFARNVRHLAVDCEMTVAVGAGTALCHLLTGTAIVSPFGSEAVAVFRVGKCSVFCLPLWCSHWWLNTKQLTFIFKLQNYIPRHLKGFHTIRGLTNRLPLCKHGATMSGKTAQWQETSSRPSSCTVLVCFEWSKQSDRVADGPEGGAKATLFSGRPHSCI